MEEGGNPLFPLVDRAGIAADDRDVPRHVWRKQDTEVLDTSVDRVVESSQAELRTGVWTRSIAFRAAWPENRLRTDTRGVAQDSFARGVWFQRGGNNGSPLAPWRLVRCSRVLAALSFVEKNRTLDGRIV